MDLFYKSTRNSDLKVTASQAVLTGLAPDGGLFVPSCIPCLDVPLEKLGGMTYQETAFAVMKLFFTDFKRESCGLGFQRPMMRSLIRKRLLRWQKWMMCIICLQGYGAVHSSASYDDFGKEKSCGKGNRDSGCHLRRYR